MFEAIFLRGTHFASADLTDRDRVRAILLVANATASWIAVQLICNIPLPPAIFPQELLHLAPVLLTAGDGTHTINCRQYFWKNISSTMAMDNAFHLYKAPANEFFEYQGRHVL